MKDYTLLSFFIYTYNNSALFYTYHATSSQKLKFLENDKIIDNKNYFCLKRIIKYGKRKRKYFQS